MSKRMILSGIAAVLVIACFSATSVQAAGGGDGVASGKEYKRHGQYKTWSR